MMARASGTIPQYTPSLYLPGSLGRYRQYPRVVRTQIPGANVLGGKLVWGEQKLNLWGAPRVRFSTNRLPLLGLGQTTSSWLHAPAAADCRGRSDAWSDAGCWPPLLVMISSAGAGALGMHLLHRFGIMR